MAGQQPAGSGDPAARRRASVRRVEACFGPVLVAIFAWAGCAAGGCSQARERTPAQAPPVPLGSPARGASDGAALRAAGPGVAQSLALDGGGGDARDASLGSPDRRLTRFELAYAVGDVFEVDASPLRSLPWPSASIGDVPDILVGRQLDRSDAFRGPYRRIVHGLADTISARLAATCRSAGAPAMECVRARLADPAARLWRTLDPGALDELEQVARPHAAEGARAMLRAAVERLLDDERFFVLQLELERAADAAGREHPGPPSGEAVPRRQATGQPARRRLANRLALVLWSSVPDLTLLRHAESGALDDPALLRAEIARMRSDPRFARFARELARQWLRLDRPPLFRPSLAERRLVSDPRRLDASVEAAARILEKSVSGGAPVPELLSEPGGLLTSAALLGAISTEIRGGGDESWLGRGLVVQSAFLCRSFPLAAIYPLALWQDHPLLDPHLAATTRRPPEPAMLATRTEDGPCWACHRQLETIGAALWMFDGLGRSASRGPHAPVSVAGQSVEGPRELARWILGTGRFEACAAQKLATYVLARAVLPLKRSADRRLVDDLSTGAKPAAGNEPTLGDWLERLLQSESFRQPGAPVVRDVPTPLASSNDYVTPRPPVAASPRACASFSPGRFLVDACGSGACHGPGSPTGAFAVADAATAAARLRAAEPRPDGYCADEPKLIDAARPAESLIIRKVTAGGAVCGAPMPVVGGGAKSLDPLDHACFVRWVEGVARGG